MIAALPLGVFAAIIVVLVAMSGLAVFAGLHARRRAALVAATPTTPIGMAQDGYREFEGSIEAVPGPTLTAPLTGWPCVWYSAKLERWEHRRSGDSSGGWILVRDVTSNAPFLVRDTTGVCIVRPWGAEVTPTDKSRWYGDSEEPADRNPPRLGPTESFGQGLEVRGHARFRYTEQRIYAGDRLLVLGEFASNRFDRSAAFDDDDDDEETAADVDDRDEAATPSASEAETLRRLALEDQLSDEARQVTRAVISRGAGAQPFILTTTAQAAHVAMSSTGGFAALGVALVPMGIAFLLIWMRFG